MGHSSDFHKICNLQNPRWAGLEGSSWRSATGLQSYSQLPRSHRRSHRRRNQSGLECAAQVAERAEAGIPFGRGTRGWGLGRIPGFRSLLGAHRRRLVRDSLPPSSYLAGPKAAVSRLS